MSPGIALFCGSRPGHDPAHARLAERAGRAIAARGWRMIYGGGALGLMGIAARAALDQGGAVTGVIPQFLVKAEVALDGLTERHIVDSMHARKRMMADLAQGFLVLPGGIGTLDETIEMMTWTILGIHTKPVVLTGAGSYWQPLTALVDHIIAEGMASPALRDSCRIEPDLERALDCIGTWQSGQGEAYSRS